MQMIAETFAEYVPTLLELVGAILGVIAVQAVAGAKKWVVAKVGQTTYDRAVEVAKGLYVLLEDEADQLKELGISKKDEMEKKLLEQFPSLSKTELDSINKYVWESFNKKYTQEGYLLEAVTEVTTEETEENLNE